MLSGTSPRSMLAVWEVRCTAILANDRRQVTSRDYGLHLLWNKWVQAVGDERSVVLMLPMEKILSMRNQHCKHGCWLQNLPRVDVVAHREELVSRIINGLRWYYTWAVISK